MNIYWVIGGRGVARLVPDAAAGTSGHEHRTAARKARVHSARGSPAKAWKTTPVKMGLQTVNRVRQ
ncbi:hypothetical protein ABIB26_001677 [Arthrobacter sp. UYEF20]